MDYTRNIASCYSATLRYRTIHLLSILMNKVIQGELNTFLMIGSVITFSVCEAGLVRLSATPENFIPAIVFVFLLLCCWWSLMLMTDCWGQIHKHSKVLMKKLKHNLIVSATRRKDYLERKHFHKSCTLLKVNLGEICYIDSLTPLNLVDLANCIAVQLLLIKTGN